MTAARFDTAVFVVKDGKVIDYFQGKDYRNGEVVEDKKDIRI